MTDLMSRRQVLSGSLLSIPAFGLAPEARAQSDQAGLARIVEEAIRPVMDEHDVPGMAVAVTVQGRRHFFSYGIASRQSGQRVSENTIFEIGSISKTFTATLAAVAQMRGALSLSENASRYWPALAGSAFDRISLLDLGTYTAGGLPLQFPAEVRDQEAMLAYFKAWRPAYPAGTQRRYSNPSIGLFGHLAARSLGRPFDDLIEQEIFPALGLASSYIRVPGGEMRRYAYGYSSDNRPIRVNPGVLASEAYGVKTSAADMIRFVEANIDASRLDEATQRAIAGTQTGYYRVGGMMQGLGWEMYAYPTDRDRLLEGNSSRMILNANAAERLTPPAARAGMLVNKTGSTNGFGAYVAFVPERRIGIVMLANRSYPIPARVTVAHRILTALEG